MTSSQRRNMTVPQSENQVTQQPSEKELNFRALEAKMKQQIEEERAGRLNAERLLQEKQRSTVEEDDDEPYVNHKNLNRKLQNFGEQTKQQTQAEINRAVSNALKDERNNNWLKNNADFHDVMKNAQKLYERDPELAETILEMPEGFERQKLVYKNIKALGLDRPEIKQASIQDKIDANKRSPYYQPSGVNAAPYAAQGDFSASGKQNAYAKMQELKSKLRI